METIKFLLAIVTIAVVMASCATTQGGYDDNNDLDNTRRVGNRVYVDDPYYGTVVLERDIVTGRYYDVTNGYRGYGSPYGGYNRNRGVYRNYPVYRGNNRPIIQRPPVSQRPVITERNRQESRDRVLGNRKN